MSKCISETTALITVLIKIPRCEDADLHRLYSLCLTEAQKLDEVIQHNLLLGMKSVNLPGMKPTNSVNLPWPSKVRYIMCIMMHHQFYCFIDSRKRKSG